MISSIWTSTHLDVTLSSLSSPIQVTMLSFALKSLTLFSSFSLGYDMEDAMIINKSAYERGFGHGSVYSTKFVDLNDLTVHYFSNIMLMIIKYSIYSPESRHALYVSVMFTLPLVMSSNLPFLSMACPYLAPSSSTAARSTHTLIRSRRPLSLFDINHRSPPVLIRFDGNSLRSCGAD